MGGGKLPASGGKLPAGAPKKPAGSGTGKAAAATGKTAGTSGSRQSGSAAASKATLRPAKPASRAAASKTSSGKPTTKTTKTTKKPSKAAAVAKKSAPKQPMTRKQKIMTGLLWTAIVLVTAAIAGVIALAVLYSRTELPDPNKDFTTATTQIYYRDADTRLGSLAVQNREPVDLADMPENLVNAVLAAEDRTFWTNPGISIPGMARAALRILGGGELQSGSTITQQYIKLMYLNDEQTVSRKLTELILAVKLNKELSKDEILEGYLNTIWFGRGAYGVQAASQAYFGVDVGKLTLPQAAGLAAILNSPGYFDPRYEGNQERFETRYRYVLDGMVTMGTLSQDLYDAYEIRPPAFPDLEFDQTYGGPKGYIMKMVEAELADAGFTDAQIFGGGLRVVTTVDADMQTAMNETAADYMDQIAETRPDEDISQLHLGMASVAVGTGEVLALYGGPDFVTQQRNWATTARMTGSTFKPYAFIAAMRNGGFSLTSKLRGDTFIPPGDTSPITNFGNVNYGIVDLRMAVQESINTAFVDLVSRTPNGPEATVRAALDAGLPEGDGWDRHDRIALGMAEVSPLNQANGYATIASYGQQATPHVVREVSDASGQVLYTADYPTKHTIETDICADLIYAMKSVVQGNGYASSIGHDAGAKSGTANTQSAWWVGYTRQVSTAVMFVAGDDGIDDLTPYRPSGWGSFTGASWPSRVWGSYMGKALADLPNEPFAPPAHVNGDGREMNPYGTPTPTPTPTPTDTPKVSATTTGTSTPGATSTNPNQSATTNPTATSSATGPQPSSSASSAASAPGGGTNSPGDVP
jgi:membrane peptidoglycan carboxypeptidase